MGIFTKQKGVSSASFWIKWTILGIAILTALQIAECEPDEPTESQCRPYIEKALKEKHLETEEKSDEQTGEESGELSTEQEENPPTDEFTNSTESLERESTQDLKESEEEKESGGDEDEEEKETDEEDKKSQEEDENEKDSGVSEEGKSKEEEESEKQSTEAEAQEKPSKEEEEDEETEETRDESAETKETVEDSEKSLEETAEDEEKEESVEETASREDKESEADTKEVKSEEDESRAKPEGESKEETESSKEIETEGEGEESEGEGETDTEEAGDEEEATTKEKTEEESLEKEPEEASKEKEEEEGSVEEAKSEEETSPEESQKEESEEETKSEEEKETESPSQEIISDDKKSQEESQEESQQEQQDESESQETPSEQENQESEKSKEETDQESSPEEEDLTKQVVIPENLRQRDHITKILRLDQDSETESVLSKAIDSTLKTLKNIYDSAIKPLEMLYKYRDLSNRHFGDPEIFSKPLILFMGPWSGGKSSTINYLLDTEFSHMALRTGAEPSPAYFNILMHGKDEEILDGTQLAADWTFSGLQKFGQGLLDRLRGVKLPNKLLEKVNIVEIPGILEIRKQVQRLFPFNDACQWFIDRADIIFLVYDPSKLDVGPETEAILDQLKGREYQTRIILNKADQVKPEELMRVQGTLIWNISPLMSSTEPPIMYTTSLWSLPYETGAPTRLLLAQERAFLRDLREAVDKRVENKIASARRFAVRVRNHAKMVDCYLTTYYNHKTFFGNKKKISDDIVENPQKYHIYEGLSTLTNISRYDLPDPDVYRDFFKINPLYDFTKLSDTCTYFRGCPINKLDVAIAYDLPELVGKYKKAVEATKEQTNS